MKLWEDKNMKYFKLYKQFLKINTMKALVYRGNLFLSCILVILESIATFFSVKIVFNHIHSIAGWNFADMMVLSGVFMFTHAISWLLFRASLGRLDILISRGDLDWMLVKPVDTQFLATMHEIDIEDAARGIVGVAVIVLGLQGHSTLQVLTSLPLFLVTFLCGQIVLYSVSLSFKTVSFKSIEGWATNAIYSRFHELARYPTDIYRGIMKIIYTFVFPLAFIATVPAKALLGTISLPFFLLAITMAFVSFLVSRMVWKWALRGYSSASS